MIIDLQRFTATEQSCWTELERYLDQLESSPDKRLPLQDVQRLWIKYRDANCGFAGSATGGTIDQVNGSGCVLDMTQTRAQELEDLVGP